MEEEINYKYLRKIQQSEKNSPKLSKLDKNFYNDVSKYLKNLENRNKKNDSLQKQKIIHEEIKNTKKIIENIYELREKKIILAAISKSRGGKPNIDMLLENEKRLFDSVILSANNSRKEILNKDFQNDIKKKPEKSNKEKIKKENKQNQNPIIVLKEDIPEFIGTDNKKYLLKKNDIISLSSDICELLSKRDTCKKIVK